LQRLRPTGRKVSCDSTAIDEAPRRSCKQLPSSVALAKAGKEELDHSALILQIEAMQSV